MGRGEEKMKRPATVTQAQIARTFRGAAMAGVRLAVEYLPDGTVRFTPVSGELAEAVKPKVAKKRWTLIK